MGDAIEAQSIPQGFGYVLLAYEFREGLGTVLSSGY